ncbi:hypothetical protein H5410_028200 [Solanum commersonii]|uniref:Uncharacterized protein n=1 Tax=Solanum commersonii TaxID=4109 RepID=A0A9J5Z5H5_SOLCO|nr:hypothetical protein H5410_028200 [Solanum commersonii]
MFLFSGEKCSLKVTIDTKTNRVVFAEGGKDLFCFLMSLLELPITIFMNHIQTKRVGSIPNIYQSVQNLNDAYMQSNQTKDQLLMSGESKSWPQAWELVQATPNRFLDSNGGYVKGLIVYMLTNAESTAEFEVKTFEFGVNEALDILEAFFQSKTVLSEAFLKGHEFDYNIRRQAKHIRNF